MFPLTGFIARVHTQLPAPVLSWASDEHEISCHSAAFGAEAVFVSYRIATNISEQS